jgi:hypothetical protein
LRFQGFDFKGFEVSDILDSKGLKFLDFRVSSFQGLEITCFLMFQSFKVLRKKSVEVSRILHASFHSTWVLRFRAFRVLIFLGNKVLRYLGVKFQGYEVFINQVF